MTSAYREPGETDRITLELTRTQAIILREVLSNVIVDGHALLEAATVEGLPPEQYQILKGFFLENRKLSELGQTHNRTAAAIGQAIHKGLELLHGLYNGRLEKLTSAHTPVLQGIKNDLTKSLGS